MTRRPLPSTGFLGWVPPLQRYYEVLRLPAAHPASLRFLRSAVPTGVPSFAPVEDRDTALAGLEGLGEALPGLGLTDGDNRVSQVPGEPSARLPCSQTPAGPRRLALAAPRCCPRSRDDEGSDDYSFSRLNHTASVLPVYASRPGSPPGHATLGSGCWLGSAGWVLPPLGSS